MKFIEKNLSISSNSLLNSSNDINQLRTPAKAIAFLLSLVILILIIGVIQYMSKRWNKKIDPSAAKQKPTQQAIKAANRRARRFSHVDRNNPTIKKTFKRTGNQSGTSGTQVLNENTNTNFNIPCINPDNKKNLIENNVNKFSFAHNKSEGYLSNVYCASLDSFDSSRKLVNILNNSVDDWSVDKKITIGLEINYDVNNLKLFINLAEIRNLLLLGSIVPKHILLTPQTSFRLHLTILPKKVIKIKSQLHYLVHGNLDEFFSFDNINDKTMENSSLRIRFYLNSPPRYLALMEVIENLSDYIQHENLPTTGHNRKTKKYGLQWRSFDVISEDEGKNNVETTELKSLVLNSSNLANHDRLLEDDSSRNLGFNSSINIKPDNNKIEILIGSCYTPLTGRLTIDIIKTSSLSSNCDFQPDSRVCIELFDHNGRPKTSLKTTIRYKISDPNFNECFALQVFETELTDITIIITLKSTCNQSIVNKDSQKSSIFRKTRKMMTIGWTIMGKECSSIESTNHWKNIIHDCIGKYVRKWHPILAASR